ncbi:MAG: NADAR family protein [Candidatus Desulforudis sp.]|nr:NADAR family protein [Desulforudis sp.]
MIKFCRTLEAYGFMNNVSPYKIELDGHVWPTVEHYYQANKFDEAAEITYSSGRTIPVRYHIRCQPTAKMAAIEGRRRDIPIRPDWEEVKDEIILKALRAKFTQHPKLREKLLATGDEELVNDSPHDSYWGTGPDGSGENRLGVLLMQVREDLSKERAG